MIGGSFERSVICISSFLRFFFPILVGHPTCVFPSLVNDMHIVCFALDVVLVFVIIGGVWSITTFSVVGKVCSLVSIGVKPIYITSSKFS
jgi:hypothetical protein